MMDVHVPVTNVAHQPPPRSDRRSGPAIVNSAFPMPPTCFECQRRKQKCSKVFPCNHCSKRGVSHLCRFPDPKAAWSKSDDNSTDRSNSAKKRAFQGTDDDGQYQDIDPANFDASHALSSLGYAPGNAWMGAPDNAPKNRKDTKSEWETRLNDEMRDALREMPPKPYTDCLVDNWLSGANHHYYALYQSEFRAQYDGWWANRLAREDVSPVVTSLILRVCASSAQFLPLDNVVRSRLEVELSEDAQSFSHRLHRAAKKLNESIPRGQGGLVQVQQLFLMAYWWKSEEQWVEAWHALGEAINVAYEIGLHQDSMSDGLSEFDREMRRRLWALLYMWDWAMATLLSRPLLINPAECQFVLPSLSLENDPRMPNFPSPFFHINVQCQLCLSISAVLENVTSKLVPLSATVAMRNEVERWFKDLPPVYALKKPLAKWDKENPWIVFQRRYLHMIGYMTIFNPLKPYLTRDSSLPMNDEDRELRESGVAAALELMDIAERFYENIYPTAPRFHYAVFCIFDTSTVLCSALVHDKGRNLPQREKLFGAVKKGLEMLEELNALAGTTTTLCRLLKNLVLQLRFSDPEVVMAKRSKTGTSTSLVGTGESNHDDHGTAGDNLGQNASGLSLVEASSSDNISGLSSMKDSSLSLSDTDQARVSSSAEIGTKQMSSSAPTHRTTQVDNVGGLGSRVPAQAPAQRTFVNDLAGIVLSDASDTSGSPPSPCALAGSGSPNPDVGVGHVLGSQPVGSLGFPRNMENHSGHAPQPGVRFGDFHLSHYDPSAGGGLPDGLPNVGQHGVRNSASNGSTHALLAGSPHNQHASSYSGSSSDNRSAMAPIGTGSTIQVYHHSDGAYRAPLGGDQGHPFFVPEPTDDVNIFGGSLDLDQASYRSFVDVWNWGVLRLGDFPFAEPPTRDD